MSSFQDNPHIWIFPHLDNLYRNEPIETVLDAVVANACHITGFGRGVMTSYLSPAQDVHIGMHNMPESMRETFRARARNATIESRIVKRDRLMRDYRVGESTVCFVPGESVSQISPNSVPSDKPVTGSWQSKDLLLLLLYSSLGEYYGILSLDEPIDGDRPDFTQESVVNELDELSIAGGRLLEYAFHLLAIRHHMKFLESAVMQSERGVILVNKTGSILSMNKLASQWFALRSHSEWNGLPLEQLASEFSVEWRKLWYDMLMCQESFQSQLPMLAEPGELVDLAVTPVFEGKLKTGFRIEGYCLRNSESSTDIGIPVAELRQAFAVILGRTQLLKRQLPEGSDSANHLHSIEVAAEEIIRRIESKPTSSPNVETVPVVLAVDDEPAMLELLCDVVSLAGEKPMKMVDGQEAWELLESGMMPKMVITDVHMPRMNGIELLRRTKQLYPDLPVVIVSAYKTGEAEALAKKHKAHSFLPKPFAIDELVGIIHQICGGASANKGNG